MPHRSLYIIDRRVRHTLSLEGGQPFGGGAGTGFAFDEGFEQVAVGDAGGVCGEAGVGWPGRVGEGGGEDGEEAVIAAAEEDVAVAGGEGAVGDY